MSPSGNPPRVIKGVGGSTGDPAVDIANEDTQTFADGDLGLDLQDTSPCDRVRRFEGRAGPDVAQGPSRGVSDVLGGVAWRVIFKVDVKWKEGEQLLGHGAFRRLFLLRDDSINCQPTRVSRSRTFARVKMEIIDKPAKVSSKSPLVLDLTKTSMWTVCCRPS